MLPTKLLNMAVVGIETEPKLTFTKKHTKRMTIKAKNGSRYVLFLGN